MRMSKGMGELSRSATLWRAASLALGFGIVFTVAGNARADEVAFDDFEDPSLTLVPFDLDYFKPGGFTMPGEFDGFSLLDVSSWIGHAGVQAGRDRCYFGSDPADRNVALVADPDEADDTGNSDMGSPSDPLFNSYARVTVDTAGLDLSTLALSFDYDFVCEDTQSGIVEISFDGGATYETVLLIDSTVDSGAFSTDPSIGSQGTFVAGTDFTSVASADTVIVQFGCIRASNDWWFAIDNVALATAVGEAPFYFEDFERDPTLADLPFDDVNDSSDSDGTDWSKDVPAEWELDNSQNGYQTEFDGPDYDPSDGTDWTRDLASIGWTIINDGPADLPDNRMYFETAEGAYNGGAVLDAFSWAYQTDSDPPGTDDETNINTGWGQERSMFRAAFFGQRNQVLVFDPDQAYDNVIPGSEEKDPPGYNSYAEKTYDVSLFDNGSLTVSLEWEVRVEEPQENVIQVSFDGGATWTTIFELDSKELGDPAVQAAFSPFLAPAFDDGTAGEVDSGDVVRTFEFGAPQEFVLSDFFPEDFVPNSNTMRMRIGCIGADNDWWFAVDEIRVEADAQAFVYGDTNGDGVVNNGDIAGGITALSGGDYTPVMDFNEDGVVNNGDIAGFINALFGN